MGIEAGSRSGVVTGMDGVVVARSASSGVVVVGGS